MLVSPSLANVITLGLQGVIIFMLHALAQGFPTFLLPCTPSAFRKISMYPFSISTDKYVPFQHFDRCTCTPKISYDNTCCHDYSQIYL